MNRIRGFLSKVSKGFAFFRKTLTNRAVRENAILLLTAPLFPKLHIRLRVKYGHYIPENPIDLSHPKLFNEKLLWLQYYIYNKSPLVQQCYDKYRVRDFVGSRVVNTRSTRYTVCGTTWMTSHGTRFRRSARSKRPAAGVTTYSAHTESRLIRNRQRKDSAAGKNNGLLSARRASFLRRKKISIIFVSIL